MEHDSEEVAVRLDPRDRSKLGWRIHKYSRMRSRMVEWPSSSGNLSAKWKLRVLAACTRRLQRAACFDASVFRCFSGSQDSGPIARLLDFTAFRSLFHSLEPRTPFYLVRDLSTRFSHLSIRFSLLRTRFSLTVLSELLFLLEIVL